MVYFRLLERPPSLSRIVEEASLRRKRLSFRVAFAWLPRQSAPARSRRDDHDDRDTQTRKHSASIG
jgi:hypothetical protein